MTSLPMSSIFLLVFLTAPAVRGAACDDIVARLDAAGGAAQASTAFAAVRLEPAYEEMSAAQGAFIDDNCASQLAPHLGSQVATLGSLECVFNELKVMQAAQTLEVTEAGQAFKAAAEYESMRALIGDSNAADCQLVPVHRGGAEALFLAMVWEHA